MVAQTIDELVCARAACAHATVTTLKLYFQSLSETGYATDTLVRRLYSIYGYTHASRYAYALVLGKLQKPGKGDRAVY